MSNLSDMVNTAQLMGKELGRYVFSSGEERWLAKLKVSDEGYGYDTFGANAAWVRWAALLVSPMYKYWFRVSSVGHKNIPLKGAAILASNHSGTLPFDALMLARDILEKTAPPRVPRMILDSFVPMLPWVSTLFSRCGAVVGNRSNMKHLLKKDELICVFPEGVPGIGKKFSERYHLQNWREGHVEFAIRYGVPIIPTAVIGAEEQMPQIARLKLPKVFGTPYLPFSASLLPLPVHYWLYYGEAIDFSKDYPPEASRDPDVLMRCSAQVKREVQKLIDEGLHRRKGVFR